MLVRLIAAKWCGLVVALVAVLLVPASPVGAVAGFGDVDNGKFFTDPVQWSVDNAITGIDGSCFSPDQPVTRGETAVWIYNMENQPEPGERHSFTDVTDASQNDAISWMSDSDITTGTSSTTFAPDETLKRAQAAAFLHRLAGEPSAPPHGFVDVSNGWQQGPVSWMSNTGITTGTSPTMFSPDGTLTRAQLITFLYRYSDKPEVTIDPDSPTCESTEQEPPVDVAVSFGPVRGSATEGGSLEIELVLSAALEHPVSIPITASGSGGAALDDYFVPSSVTVPSGVTSHTFTVVAYSDTAADTGEGLVLGFGPLSEGVVAGDASTSPVQIEDQPISEETLDSTITVPDANFKAALQDLLDKLATEEITVREARSITTLNIAGLEISDLTGIEHFVNLESLHVYNNLLSELVLPVLPKLTSLDASGNQLSSLVLEPARMPALQYLDLNRNQFSELVLDGFTELSSVDMSYNAIETVVLRNLPNIHSVHKDRSGFSTGAVALGGNPVRDFTAVNLPSQGLSLAGKGDLADNGNWLLESIVLEGLPNLVSLFVQDNELSELVLPVLPKLTSLYASGNQLSSLLLEPARMPALQHLDLNRNQFSELVLDGFTELSSVDMSYNAIETVVLRNLPNIHSVHKDSSGFSTGAVALGGNPVRDFTAVNLPSQGLSLAGKGDLADNGNWLLESIVLEGLPNLVSLFVQDNELSELVLPVLPKLTSLYASGNQLSSLVLEPARMPALQHLDLNRNQFSELVLDGFTELSSVDMSYNAIETVVLRNLPNIHSVHKDSSGFSTGAVALGGNPVRDFTAVNLPSQGLSLAGKGDLADNGNWLLESIVLEGLPNLVSLFVQDNELSELVLPVLPKLTSLYASGNQLSSLVLEPARMPALQHLDLNRNQFSELVLDGFTELSSVDMSYNAIETVVLRNLPNIHSVHKDSSGFSTGAVALGGNPVRDFTAVNLPSQGLSLAGKGDLADNGNWLLESIVLEGLPNLVSLFVQDNELSELVLPVLPKLTSLYASGNQLSSLLLEPARMPALQHLDLNRNQFSELVLDGFTELSSVDMSYNAIETVVLRNLPNIHSVHKDRSGFSTGAVALGGNPVRDFTAVNLPSQGLSLAGKGDLADNGNWLLESIVLEGLPNLVSLFVQDNELSELVLPVLPKLTSLYASGNQLSSLLLEPARMPALQHLDLNRNQFSELVLDGFTELSSVDMSYNAIETVVLRNLPNIHSVHKDRSGFSTGAVALGGNPVRDFTAVNLPSQGLSLAGKGDLADNGNWLLESIVLEGLPNLVSLFVQDNELSELVLPVLPKLTSLYASGNQLSSLLLEPARMPALQHLDLNRNQFSELVLDGFTELSSVDMSYNAIETVVLRNLPNIHSVHKDRSGFSTGAVALGGNPGVKVFYDYPEELTEGEESAGDVDRLVSLPGRPQSLRVEDAGDGVDGRGSFTVRWDAPVREGDSAVEGYTVTVSHPRVPPSVAAWRQSYDVTDRSFRFDHGDRGYTYEVSVRARNSFGAGPLTSEEITISCVHGDKYEMKRDGGVGPFAQHNRVYALQDFKLVPNGWQIRQGYKGGVVFDTGSLSQDGCAWIYEDAAVEGLGKVSGNAVLVNSARVKDRSVVSGNAVISGNAKLSNFARVYGNAKISGNAEVYDNAHVYGDARVSGDAKVYGDSVVSDSARVSNLAQVYGDAEVYGNARVSGRAKVYGYAKVYGNAVLSARDEASCDSRGHESCYFNGDLEYKYVAKQLKQNLYNSLYNDFLECGVDSADAQRSTNEIVYPRNTPSSEAFSQIALGLLAACGRLKVYRDIIQEFTPGLVEFVLQWAFLVGRAATVGTFAASLIELLEGIDDIRALVETRIELDDILKTAREMALTK